MRGLFLTLVSFACFFSVNAQKHEIGALLGFSNFVGDVGELNYINPTNPAYGPLYKYNAHERYAIRASIMVTKLKGDDLESDLPSRTARGKFFTNVIIEVGAGFEFNFVRYQMYSDKTQFIPYVATGISYFFMDNLYYPNNGRFAKKINKKADLNIPLTLGLKSNFAKTVMFGLEVGARYTFSENIDGSGYGVGFGNPNSNDWYFFSGITATVILGNGKSKDCRCPF